MAATSPKYKPVSFELDGRTVTARSETEAVNLRARGAVEAKPAKSSGSSSSSGASK